MKTFLTKSKFTHCLECPTKLYYKNHEDEYATSQDDNDFLKALAEGGIQVGELAKLYYSGGVEIPYSRDKSVSIEQTKELLQQDEVIIYEAAIRHELTYSLVDILVKEGNDIQLIEVKSKSWESGESFYKQNGELYPKCHKYLYDVAFQTWARMQFDDVTEKKRKDVFEALLRYCELDTLAMVMIYQHWNYLKK